MWIYESTTFYNPPTHSWLVHDFDTHPADPCLIHGTLVIWTFTLWGLGTKDDVDFLAVETTHSSCRDRCNFLDLRFFSICPSRSRRSIPSGKRFQNYGKSQFLMGKSTICMAIFNSFLYVYQAGYLITSSRSPPPSHAVLRRYLCMLSGHSRRRFHRQFPRETGAHHWVVSLANPEVVPPSVNYCTI